MNAPPPPPDEASPSPEAAFQEILRGVNITETTFHIDDTCNENRGKESIAIIRDVIDQLNKLWERAPNGVLRDDVHRKADFLHKVKDAIIVGTYFSSIEDVWESQPKSLDTVDAKLFDRTYDMLEHMPAGNGYIATANGANVANSIAADSSSQTAVDIPRNIFGVVNATDESAHLMPHSRNCSALWYHLVPWVLYRLDNPGTPIELWTIFQKCIHGFKSGTKRQNGVGIKHFQTNRIRLSYQKLYLDDRYCLLIVPILTVDEIKGWNGSGYSAMVLAGIRKNGSAEAVYSDIKAHRGTIEFANEEECKRAYELLGTMVLCIGKSSRDTFTDEFRNEAMVELYNGVGAKNPPIYIKKDQATVHIPTSKHWNNHRVRKITFSDVEGENPAPDPVLLLGKAASNWLKRQGIFVLPGCDEDESSSDSSDFVASLRDEFALRGWSYDMPMRPPHVKGIVEVTCRPENVDEPLSDDDDE